MIHAHPILCRTRGPCLDQYCFALGGRCFYFKFNCNLPVREKLEELLVSWRSQGNPVGVMATVHVPMTKRGVQLEFKLKRLQTNRFERNNGTFDAKAMPQARLRLQIKF